MTYIIQNLIVRILYNDRDFCDQQNLNYVIIQRLNFTQNVWILTLVGESGLGS